MKELRFGPAGIPRSTPKSGTEAGIEQVKKLGLGCMEMAFVRQVYLNDKSTPGVKDAAKKSDVVLTAHGSYFINLNSEDKKIVEASKKRIMDAARATWDAGGWSVTFHPAYYLKDEPKVVYDRVKKILKELTKTLRSEGNKIWVRPETTGKAKQFGDLDELLKLSQEIEGVMPCIDFAHIHARTIGKYNTKSEFQEILEKIEKALGREGLNNMHIHMTGIAYGEKGEKHHLNLKDSDLKYKELVKVWKEFKIKGCVQSESPNQEVDALMLQKLWKK